MSDSLFAQTLSVIFRELIQGSPDPGARTYVLNQGDQGLLASLDRLSAEAASARYDGGASIAAHVDHLRYGFSLLNRWGDGLSPPWPAMDWTESWRRNVVSEDGWKRLREEFRRETARWVEVLNQRREVSENEAGWIAVSVIHLAYHLGAIRQIDRSLRGPTAEDEARARG